MQLALQMCDFRQLGARAADAESMPLTLQVCVFRLATKGYDHKTPIHTSSEGVFYSGTCLLCRQHCELASDTAHVCHLLPFGTQVAHSASPESVRLTLQVRACSRRMLLAPTARSCHFKCVR